ncbi:holo-ACP synthase [Candidatus Stoquefichus massiliensis]|uniref:holo-ACP synthase n=1 Tax=Candidatus Stoquefichus massiliensis TaxID=1470350 RepID=UPI0004BC9D2E|nr:holo-ACP synthase [Candidatus Stoquefichus massiliensis]
MRGIGVDIIDLDRLDIENLHFVERILSVNEYQLFCQMKSKQRRLEFLGGRFAGKEAYLKANHKGLGGIDFHDIEILNDKDGSPYLNDKHALISISHEKKYAIAFVVVEK